MSPPHRADAPAVPGAPQRARSRLAAVLLLGGLVGGLIGGAAGVVRGELQARRWALWPSPRSAFWEPRTAGGTPARFAGPDEEAGWLLAAGHPAASGSRSTSQAIALVPDDGRFHHFERLSLQVMPESASSSLEVRLRDDGNGAVLLQLRPGTPPQLVVRLPAAIGGGGTPEAGSVALPAPTWQPRRPVALQLAVRDEQLSVAVNGRSVLSGVPLGARPGTTTVAAAEGAVRLLRLAASGAHSNELGARERFDLEVAWRVPGPEDRRRTVLATLAGIGAGLAVVAGWLLALCRGRPGAARLAGATAVVGAAALAPGWLALLTGGGPLPPHASPDLIAASCGFGLLALPLALRRLGPALRKPAPRGRLARARAAAIALLLSGTVGAELARSHWDVVRPQRQREARASALAVPPDVTREPQLALDASNALVIPGPFRDVELRADVTLAPDGALGVRVHAPDANLARGLLCVLSADRRLPTGFRREDTLAFEPLGTAGPSQPSGRTLPLRIVSRGRELAAFVGDQRVAEAHDESMPAGALVLLALRGKATVSGLTVRASPAARIPEPTAAGEWRAWLLPALLPGLALLAFSLATARGLRLSWPEVLEPSAFACLPFLLAWAGWRQSGGLAPDALRWSGLAAVVLLFVVPVLHARPGQAARACGVFALAAAGVPATMSLAVGPDLVLDEALVNRTHYAIWSGERQEDDLLFLTHPRFRLMNGWLARHRLRSGEHSLRKAPGRQRVLTLGASCTWGYLLPPGAGLEFPAQLAGLLAPPRPAGGAPPVEVLNAASMGAPGFVLLRYFRDVLVQFEPDVLVLMLFYGDAHRLSQGDEERYFAEITAPGFSRGPLFDFRELVRLHSDRDRYESLLERLQADPASAETAVPPESAASADVVAALWSHEDPEATPPARWAAMLRSFAGLCRDRGIDLVLVKEPLAGDAPRPWKDEFYALMDDVGAEFGVPVVDPRAALAAAGGKHLFFDGVHPNEAGHAVLAQEIAPVVRALLDRRAAR